MSHGRLREALLGAVILLLGCGDSAIIVEVRTGNFAIPGELDAFCIGAADDDPRGGYFGRRYHFGSAEGQFANFPQTLTIDPGEASTATVWTRGYGLATERAREVLQTDFGGRVRLLLDACSARCVEDAIDADMRCDPQEVASAAAPNGSVVAISFGRGGPWLLASGAGSSALYRTEGDQLVDAEAAVPPIGTAAPQAIAPVDADGDCDDDFLVIPEGRAPELWVREDAGFTRAEGAVPDVGEMRAVAIGDFNIDSIPDAVVVGAGGGVVLRGDGAGKFEMVSELPEVVDDATAVAAGDLDADGLLDVVVGRGSQDPAPPMIFLGRDTAEFVEPGAQPTNLATMRATAIAVSDFDGDNYSEILIAGDNEPVRAYTNLRTGEFEDDSIFFFPLDSALTVTEMLLTPTGGDCVADVLLTVTGDTAKIWPGILNPITFDDGVDSGVSATSVAVGDLDGNGSADIALAGDGEVHWLRR